MAQSELKWGICATIKAPAQAILNFAAYHLDLGAHRLHIYLDEPNPEASTFLDAHPKIRVHICDDTYWKHRKRKRPGGHQFRQTLNATHAYYRAQVDWLAHIDVDEFLWPDVPLENLLTSLPDTTACARIRPVESLPRDGHSYKALIPAGPDQDEIVRNIFPRYGAFMKGGFMSHVAGKLFARTGLKKTQFRIHNLFQDEVQNPGMVELDSVDLCHRHFEGWEDWVNQYHYRLAKGSYRPGLAPNVPAIMGGLSKHELLNIIEDDHGLEGLRSFYDEISAQDPDVFDRLLARGLIKTRDLQLDKKRRKHFPEFG